MANKIEQIPKDLEELKSDVKTITGDKKYGFSHFVLVRLNDRKMRLYGDSIRPKLIDNYRIWATSEYDVLNEEQLEQAKKYWENK